ncbi:MAG TPA: preQ(1) synthase [bacterium]|nr:preQ(1) synthase [bacterium]
MTDGKDMRLSCQSPKHIRADLLETFPYQGPSQTITYTSREFSAVCPFSGLPDVATVEIIYIPDEKCLELKSLKLYFVSYRNVGIYQEHATQRIFEDLKTVISPRYLKITTRYATRGGIDAECCIESDHADSCA